MVYQAALSGNSLPTFRDNLLVHLQGLRNPRTDIGFLEILSWDL
jgi:hypothetical protein